MAVNFSGLATGLDTSTLIAQLVKAEGAPIDRLAAKQALIDARSKKLTTLRSKLDDFRNAALALDSRADALPASASSGDESIVRAAATGGASPGRFEVRVERLAAGARVYSDRFAAPDTAGAFGTGTLEIQTSAGTGTITVDSADTLTSVRGKIQALGLPVDASILDDGSGYRLQLAGRGVGSANALTVTEGGLTLGLDDPANVASTAVDAQIRVDGMLVTRPSNTLADVFPGVTLEARGLSPVGGSTTVEIGHDSTALVSRLQRLVDTYNAVNTFIAAEVTWTGNDKPLDSLSGDSTLRSVQARLRSALLAPVAGTSGAHTTLASLGVSIRRDGSLALDGAKVASALASDPEGVAAVLGTSGTGAMAILAEEADHFAGSADGVLTQRLTSMSTERRGLGERMERMQSRIDKYEVQLRSQYAALEQLVSGLQSQGAQLTAALSALDG